MDPAIEPLLTAVAVIAVVIITAIVCYMMDQRGSRVADLEWKLAGMTVLRDHWQAEYKNAVADAEIDNEGWLELLGDDDDDSDSEIDLLADHSDTKHRTLWMYSEGDPTWQYMGRTESPDLPTSIGHSVIGELDPLMTGEYGQQEVMFEVRYMTAEEIQAIPTI